MNYFVGQAGVWSLEGPQEMSKIFPQYCLDLHLDDMLLSNAKSIVSAVTVEVWMCSQLVRSMHKTEQATHNLFGEKPIEVGIT